MNKRIGLYICLLPLILLPGCWSKIEPKNLAIVNSVIYDKNEDGTYSVTVEIMHLAASSEQGGNNTGNRSANIIETCTGDSVREAVENQSQTIDKKNYGRHNHARFFTEIFAQNESDMAAVLDFVLRDRLADESPLMVVIKGDEPEKIYSASRGLSETVGMYLDALEVMQPTEIAGGVFVNTLDFVKDYYEQGKEPVAGLIEIVQTEDPTTALTSQGSSSDSDGSEKSYKLIYEGLAAFKGTKLVGFMNANEAQAYNFITNHVETAVISVPSGSSRTALKIGSSKCEIKTKVENGRVTLDAKIKITLSVVMEGGGTDIGQTDEQKAIEQVFNRQMQKEILSAVEKAQREFKSDIFGFGEYMHIQHPKEWEQLKDNWNDVFSSAAVNITVDSSIVDVGQIKKSFILGGSQ